MDTSWHLARAMPVTESGCWIWLGAEKGNGYGNARYMGRNYPAHRLAFLLSNGHLPASHDICHRCDNRLCINPDHLFAGSRLENMRDAQAKGRLSQGDSHAGFICGEKSSAAKLTVEQVEAIRRAAHSRLPIKDIAAIAGVSADNVRRIVRFDTWKEINKCAA